MFDSRYEVYLADTTESRSLHHQVRYQVFCVEKGFEQPGKFSDCQELDRWDRHSHHFVVQDRESGAGVAAMRIVLPAAGQLPVDHLGCIPARPANVTSHHQVAEISRICMVRDNSSSGRSLPIKAVSPKRGPEVLLGLIRAIIRYSWDNNVPYQYMLVTRPFARMLKRLGVDCTQVGEAIEHRGLRTPYLIDVNASWERLVARSEEMAEMFSRHHLAYFSHAEMQPRRLALKAAGGHQMRPRQAAA